MECMACGYKVSTGNVEEREDGLILCSECAKGRTCPNCGTFHEEAVEVGDWDLDGKVRCTSCYRIPEKK